MKQTESSRLRDQRVDIKISPQVNKELNQVKAILEEARGEKLSASEVISIMCDWAEPNVKDLRDLRAKTAELTTKKYRPKPLL